MKLNINEIYQEAFNERNKAYKFFKNDDFVDALKSSRSSLEIIINAYCSFYDVEEQTLNDKINALFEKKKFTNSEKRMITAIRQNGNIATHENKGEFEIAKFVLKYLDEILKKFSEFEDISSSEIKEKYNEPLKQPGYYESGKRLIIGKFTYCWFFEKRCIQK